MSVTVSIRDGAAVARITTTERTTAMEFDLSELPPYAVGHDFRIAPTFIPRTKTEALLLAASWGRTLSHWNAIATTERHDELGQAYRAEAIAQAAIADAGEVQRLAALAQMLPDTTAGSDGAALLAALAPAQPKP